MTTFEIAETFAISLGVIAFCLAIVAFLNDGP